MTWLQQFRIRAPAGRALWLTRVRLTVVPVILALPLLGPAVASAQLYDSEAYIDRDARRYGTTAWFDTDYDDFTSGYDDIYEFGGEYYGYDVYSYADAYDPIEIYSYQSGDYNIGVGGTYYTDRWYAPDDDFSTWYD